MHGRTPLDGTVRHSVLGILQDKTGHFRGFVLAETLVLNDEPCHLRGFTRNACDRLGPGMCLARVPQNGRNFEVSTVPAPVCQLIKCLPETYSGLSERFLKTHGFPPAVSFLCN